MTTTVLAQPIKGYNYYVEEGNIPGEKSLESTLLAAPLLFDLMIFSTNGDPLQWWERSIAMPDTTLSALISATITGTTLHVAQVQARIGDIIECQSPLTTTATERMYVSAISVTSKTYTVTREYDGTTKTYFSAGSTVRVIGNAVQEGHTYTAGITVAPDRKQNNLQETSSNWQISGKVSALAQQSGVDRATTLDASTLLEHYAKIERAALTNLTSTASANGVAGKTKGFAGWFSTNDMTIKSNNCGGTTTSTVLNMTKVNTFFNRLNSYGGSNLYILHLGTTAFAALLAALRSASTAYHLVTDVGAGKQFGVAYTEFITDNGTRVLFRQNRNCRAGDMWAFDIGQPDIAPCGIAFLAGRELVEDDFGADKDLIGKNYISDWGVVCAHEEVHGRITGIVSGG